MTVAMTVAKKIQWLLDAGNPEWDMRLGPVLFDQRRGLGQVPDNGNVAYLGFGCLMTPSQFHALVPRRDFGAPDSNLTGIIEAMRAGMPIGSPFLDIIAPEECAFSQQSVRAHEGYTRMEAIRRLFGEVPVLVHVFLAHNMRARHICTDHLSTFRASLVPEKTKTAITGPHCDEVFFFGGKWVHAPQGGCGVIAA